MIDSTFSLQLVERVASALRDRIAGSTLDSAVTSDLEKIRRLVLEGHINRTWMRQVLDDIVKNESIGVAVRDAAATELADQFADVQLALSAQRDADADVYLSSDTLVPGNWPAGRLESGGWTRVVGEELTKFLAQIGPIDGRIRVHEATTQCHWHLLPWYQNSALVRVRDPAWSNQTLAIYYVTHLGNLYRLNGSSPPIHELNQKVPIELSDRIALDYLKFFCFFVHGDEGPFYVFESEADPLIPRSWVATLSEDDRRKLVPASVKEVDAQNRFSCHATILYGNAIFAADFLVDPSGKVEMIGDSPIRGELPERLEVPIK